MQWEGNSKGRCGFSYIIAEFTDHLVMEAREREREVSLLVDISAYVAP